MPVPVRHIHAVNKCVGPAATLIAKPTPIQTTHQALADELGSLREIVSRLLMNFAEQGWMRLGREQIEILDAVAVKEFANL